MNWYDDHRNLAVLAHDMAAEGDAAEAVAYMLEKPWAFEADWHAAMALRDAAIVLEVAGDDA